MTCDVVKEISCEILQGNKNIQIAEFTYYFTCVAFVVDAYC